MTHLPIEVSTKSLHRHVAITFKPREVCEDFVAIHLFCNILGASQRVVGGMGMDLDDDDDDDDDDVRFYFIDLKEYVLYLKV